VEARDDTEGNVAFELSDKRRGMVNSSDMPVNQQVNNLHIYWFRQMSTWCSNAQCDGGVAWWSAAFVV